MKNRFVYIALTVLVVLVIGIGWSVWKKSHTTMVIPPLSAMMPYSGNIIQETKNNTYFRKVLFTGKNTQLVVMDIKPGEDVGEETHLHAEQILFLLSGKGEAVLNGVSQPFEAGQIVVVTPGTKHNFINTGTEPLKIYTIYSPPNHIDGRIQKTKEDAEKDTADEAFGNRVE